MSRGLSFSKLQQIRWYSTKERMKVIESVDELLLKNEIKHKKHPGIVTHKHIEQPQWLLQTINVILSDEHVSAKVLHRTGQKLALHLDGRHPPTEKEELSLKVQEVTTRLQKRNPQTIISNENLSKNRNAVKLFKELVYNWAPIEYDKYTSLSYLVMRSVPEYCVLYKLFNEINSYDANFEPKSFFDFGSGVGTAMWATSQFWYKSIKEYFCVDISSEMNNLSECLIKRAKPQIRREFIFYRQFLPVSSTRRYDIVISAYSLLELPSQQSRLETLWNLWQKTANYLIIVEQGTRGGFTLINEARDFILNYRKNTSGAYVVSPCPHDLECPRYATDDTPCNFEIFYLSLPIYQKATYKPEKYSYVILKKGNRPEDDCQWPRIVRPTLKRSKHVICRLCTASGELKEHIFTAWKNGKNTYRCARSSKWGDRLPFQMEKLELSGTENFDESEKEKVEQPETEMVEESETEKLEESKTEELEDT